MARARLHIICGNCGCNDMFTYSVVRDGNDYGTHREDAAYLHCGNCATSHDIGDNASKDDPGVN